MEEIWKQIDGYNGRYEISNMGRIKSYAQDKVNGKIYVGCRDHKGYLVAFLSDGNQNKRWHKVHRLVAEAFIPNAYGFEQVNHKDENKENNCVDNLEWCTCAYNVNYGTKVKRTTEKNKCCPTTSHKVYSIDKYGTIEYFNSIGEAERLTGIPHGNIVKTLNGERLSSGGRKWFNQNI